MVLHTAHDSCGSETFFLKFGQKTCPRLLEHLPMFSAAQRMIPVWILIGIQNQLKVLLSKIKEIFIPHIHIPLSPHNEMTFWEPLTVVE